MWSGGCFREFAITLAVTIVISAVVALTLVPMMCAKILRHQQPSEMLWIARKSREWFDALIARYGRLLNWVLDHQPLTLLVAVATLALTVFLYIVIPKGFFPVQDTGLIQGISVASPSVSFAAMSERQQALAAVVLDDPDVDSLTSFIGVDGTNTTLNSGRFLINLKPRDQRQLGQRHYPAAAEGDRKGRRDHTLYAAGTGFARSTRRSADPSTNSCWRTPIRPSSQLWVPKLLQRLEQIPQIEDVGSTFSQNGLSAYVQIDRPTAGRFGITPADRRQCALRSPTANASFRRSLPSRTSIGSSSRPIRCSSNR